MRDMWEKLGISVGIIFFIVPFYIFLSNGSPLNLILSIFGLLFIVNGIFEKRDNSETFYYLFISVLIIYFGVIITYICLFDPVFLKDPNFYFYTPVMVLWIISFFFRYKRTRKYVKLLKRYDDELNLNSNDSTTWNNKGTAFTELSDYKKAIKCFDKAIELDPKNAAAWHNKAVSLTKRRKHQEAAKYYDKSVELDGTFVIAKKAGNIILKYGY